MHTLHNENQFLNSLNKSFVQIIYISRKQLYSVENSIGILRIEYSIRYDLGFDSDRKSCYVIETTNGMLKMNRLSKILPKNDFRKSTNKCVISELSFCLFWFIRQTNYEEFIDFLCISLVYLWWLCVHNLFYISFIFFFSFFTCVWNSASYSVRK